MTTLTIRNGGYLKVIHVDQSEAEILALCDNCAFGHSVVYSPLIKLGEWALGWYDEKNEWTENVGGKVYTGWGSALGWETALQIGPDCRLFYFGYPVKERAVVS